MSASWTRSSGHGGSERDRVAPLARGSRGTTSRSTAPACAASMPLARADPAGWAARPRPGRRSRASPRSGGTRPTGTRDAESSRSRKDRNWSGVIVSRTSTWATSVLRIFSDAVEQVERRVGVAGLERPLHRRQLVAELLEPQLVHLVDDDEQQLVVLRAVRPVRALDLEREQLGDLEIRGVGDGAAGHPAMVRRRPRVSPGRIRMMSIAASSSPMTSPSWGIVPSHRT